MAVTDDVKKAQQRIRQKKYCASHKEKIAAKSKAYYAANAEKLRARHKAYTAANKDKVLTKKKEYHQKNKDVCHAKEKAWRKANLVYKNACDRARRARKKAIAAGEIPPPIPKIADFRAQHDASGCVAPAASTDVAPDDLLDEDDDDVSHPLAATTKKVVMVSFTDEHPFNMRERGPEPCCDECALFQPNALTSATNTVLLAGTYQCTFCRDWTYYRLHRKHKRTRADARLDALTA